MRSFRLLCVALCLMLFAVPLAGCSGGKSNLQLIEVTHSESDDDLLTFFGYKEDAISLNAIEQSLHGFLDVRPDTNITYEGVRAETYYTALERRSVADVLDNIFMVDTATVLNFKEKDLLADLSDISGLDSYCDLAKSQFVRSDGTVLFMPLTVSTYGLYVNYGVLEKHGQKVPTNYAEFAATCDYFTDIGITPVIVNAYASLKYSAAARAFFPLYRSEDPGAEIQRLNADPAATAQLLKPGIEFVDGMLKKGWVDYDEADDFVQLVDDKNEFLKNERPFLITGSWASQRIRISAPEIDYGVHPLPYMDDGCAMVVNVESCVSVKKTGEYVQPAKEFLSYVINTDTMWDYCNSQSTYYPRDLSRKPADPAIAPSTPYLNSDRMVIGADYRWTLPVNTGIKAAISALIRGADVDEACAVMLGVFEEAAA